MNSKGFTLIEVLIGLFIAVIAATYAAKTITSTNKLVAAGRETFIATNLVHEGIDLTRAMRDNTWFTDESPESRSDWMSTSGICETEENHAYAIDPEVVRDFLKNQDNIVLDKSQSALYIQSKPTKLWTHTVSDEQTAFVRVLSADCTHVNDDPAVVEVTSTVTWEGQGGIEKKVQVKELLYNWWL